MRTNYTSYFIITVAKRKQRGWMTIVLSTSDCSVPSTDCQVAPYQREREREETCNLSSILDQLMIDYYSLMNRDKMW
jgi:hypothetical protein